MRLIDSDSLKTKVEAMVEHRMIESDYDFGRNQAFDYVADILIDDAPTIDAVEVVRCKDCLRTNGYDKHIDRWWCSMHRAYMPDDYYCADGLRKEQNNEP